MATRGSTSRVNRPAHMQMATLSSLAGYPTAANEWPLDRKIQEIKDEGFDGFMSKIPPAGPVTAETVAKHGVPFWSNQDLGRPEEVRPRLTELKGIGARLVNTQVGDHDTPIPDSIKLAINIMRTADELGMDVSIEMHRDTGTETPEKTFAIADGYEKATRKKLKMNFDFSHFALTKGLRPPFFERLTVRPDLIWVANQLHLRPFNGHHCQIPVIDHRGAHTPEFTDWLEFVDGLIGLWLQKAAPGATLWTCPELIGGAYGLSTFPKNWVQAKVVREELDKIWNRRIRAWKAPAPARA